MFNKLIRNTVASIFSITTAVSCLSVNATIVEFQTSQGNIQVNLFDEATPKTVENFLAYQENGAYTDSIFHRSVSNFILQGGGFKLNGDQVEDISANPAVINEPVFSNVSGTIAMAKLGSDENSATNQWFFNINNNSANLDVQNGGFTVFGQLVDDADTTATMNAIANISTCNAGGALTDVPLVNYDCSSDVAAAAVNYVTVYNITVVDSSSATADTLTPVRNTLIDQVDQTSSSDSSGGSIYWMLMVLFTSFVYRKSNKLS